MTERERELEQALRRILAAHRGSGDWDMRGHIVWRACSCPACRQAMNR